MAYTFTEENFVLNIKELLPLYVQHYREMQERLSKAGVAVPDYNPRYEEYFKAYDAGYLLHWVVRTESGEPIGYCNVYLSGDMHNSELIAQEDTIFIRKDHRNGVGRKLVKFGLEELRKRGVKRLNVQALTDLRVAKLWQRIGFKPVALCMTYIFPSQ